MSSLKFTDCHCHLLPGLDDGPADPDEAVEMAGILAALGFSEVVCTPHFLKGAYDCNPDSVRTSVSTLQKALKKGGIAVTVRASVEYYFDEYLLDFLDAPLRLGDNIVLVEAHRNIDPQFLSEAAYRVITHKRLLPLIAHPERYDLFDCVLEEGRRRGLGHLARTWRNKFFSRRLHTNGQEVCREPENTVRTLRDMGCLLQGNIGSFAGLYGEQVRKRALCLLRLGLYDRLGTDAHRPGGLASWLEEGLHIVTQETGEEGLASLLRPLESPRSFDTACPTAAAT